MKRKIKPIAFLASLSFLLLLLTITALADGTEKIDVPSIPIASGTGIIAGGVGLQEQPGDINISVPEGVAVNQVLLYWGGEFFDTEEGDDTVTVNGQSVTGDLIGGPTLFYISKGNRVLYAGYRADVTNLNLVSDGDNTLTINDMEFEEPNGASIVIIYDNGQAGVVDLYDGVDTAYLGFPEPRKTTIPVTYTFEADDIERTAELTMIAGSAKPDRPSVVRITVGEQTTEYFDLLGSNDGADWDTVTVPVMVPAGVTTISIEAQSYDDESELQPASLVWIGQGLSIPPPEDQPTTECVDFSQLMPGSSVEGLGTIHPDLNLSSNGGNAIATLEGNNEWAAYGAPNDAYVANGGLPETGGFYDLVAKSVPNTQTGNRGPNLSFTFAEGQSYGSLSLRMLDFGDWNPVKGDIHQAALTAFDIDGNELFVDTLRFPSNGTGNPTYLFSQTGDAVTANPGEPGNFFFKVFDTDSRIVRAELAFSYEREGVVYENSSSDPYIGFADLCFGPPPPEPVCVDFSTIEPGTSIEGLGTVQSLLNIGSNGGDLVSTVEGNNSWTAYGAPNDAYMANGGMPETGGFYDTVAKSVPSTQLENRGPNLSFTFEPGTTTSYLTLRMLDYGDWNPVRGNLHSVSLAGFDSEGNEIASDSLRFASDGTGNPAELFDRFGDAVKAAPGEPGNHLFTVYDFFDGQSFDRVDLQFSYEQDGVVYTDSSSDPYIGFADLCFSPIQSE